MNMKLSHYDSEYEIWEIPEKINNTEGYWIKLDDSDTLTVEGIYPWGALIPLYEGWNLIGFPLLQGLAVADLFVNDTVYAYNSSWSSYIPERPFNSLQTLKPGYGYWVYIN